MHPIKIALNAKIVPIIEPKLDFPHVLIPLPDDGDAEIARLLASADVLVSARFKTAWRTEGMSLKLVLTTGAGIDAVEVSGLPPGCKLANVYGHERALTEQAVMLMLALIKNVFPFDKALRRGNWTPEKPMTRELRGHNLLILGLGHIGCELARWAVFMEMHVTALTRSPEKARTGIPAGITVGGYADLASHLPKTDFLVVAIPATAESTGLIGEKELKLMKPSSFIVNVGRGSVIQERPLYEALRTKQIAGAGLDVWYQYPTNPGQEILPSKLPFQELDNVIMTPHKATVETMEYRWPEIAKNIGRFARGEALVNRVL